ncbi:hypothetical protein BCR44DRAFT_239733, partial [Catenaria anguillulae PL171]
TVDDSPTAKVLDPLDNLHLGSPAEHRRLTLKRAPEDSPDALAHAVHAQAPTSVSRPTDTTLQANAPESMRARLFHNHTHQPDANVHLVHGLADMALETPARATAASSRGRPPPTTSTSTSVDPRRQHWTQTGQPVPDSPMPIDSTMADATNIRATPATVARKTTGPVTWTLTSVPDTPVADTPTPVVRAGGAGVTKIGRQPVFDAPARARARAQGASAVAASGEDGAFKVPGMPASAMRRGTDAAWVVSTPVAQIRPRFGAGIGASRRSGAGGTTSAAAGVGSSSSRLSGSGF